MATRVEALATVLADIRATHGPVALARGWTERSGVLRPFRPSLPPWWPGQLPSIPRTLELRGATSCGKLSLALAWLAALPTAGTIAVVDERHDFYPPSAWRAGIAPERLVIVRPPTPRDAIRAALDLLGSGGFDAVLWPLGTSTRPNGLTSTRLAQLAGRQQTTLVVLTETARQGAVLTSANVRLVVERHNWRVEDGELAGVRLTVCATRQRGTLTESTWDLTLEPHRALGLAAHGTWACDAGRAGDAARPAGHLCLAAAFPAGGGAAGSAGPGRAPGRHLPSGRTLASVG